MRDDAHVHVRDDVCCIDSDVFTGFDCKDCGATLSSSYHLKRHASNVHGRELLRCSKCHYTFLSEAELAEHEAVKHSALGEKCAFWLRITVS